MRNASIQRKTSETHIRLQLDLDGNGRAEIRTGIPFFDHMLEQTTRHGLLDLTVHADGDLEVGFHHTVEDVGICFGRAVRNAIGDASRIRRFGHAQIPMDDSLASVTLDVSGRPFLGYKLPPLTTHEGTFPLALTREFFRALSVSGAVTLHIRCLEGEDGHHIVEAVFKAFGRALMEAVTTEGRISGIPSTKGVLT